MTAHGSSTEQQHSKKKTWLWWSSGKDSAWSLHALAADPDYEVTALVTTINVVADRVAMHAVRTELLRAQAERVGLPLHIGELPHPCPNGVYEEVAARLVAEAEAEGVTHMAFGDLFLEDVRDYRLQLLADTPIEPVFPLWGLDTARMARDVVDGGVRAVLTCVDPKQLDPSFVGRAYDHALLDELPPGVDPCGENGEFHSFVHDSPEMSRPIEVEVGERIQRDGFWFADVRPTG